MFKKVSARLNFTTEDEAQDFYHDCEIALGKSQTINPGQENEERSLIVLEECHHDENPQATCQVLKMDETPTGKL